MMSRGRGGSWDPMQDDFDNSFSAQYPDEDASDHVHLDYTKLYVSRLPPALSQDGLASLFAKYGKVVKHYFSRDVNKNYAFVQFETSGEAKIAMMKLNKTEPLNLNIKFAHRKNNQNNSQPNIDRSYSNTERTALKNSHTDRQNREDSVNIMQGQKPRNEEEHTNGDEDGDETEGSEAGVDPSLAYDLEQLKHQQLQIMAEQLKVKQRMMIYQRMKNSQKPVPVTKRRVLPDGQIQAFTQDNETSITTGGGDSRNIPGLQRESSRRCVVCDASAELYCASCKVTPYCSERCQRRDWERRHRGICHNLARSSIDAVKPTTNDANESPAGLTANVGSSRPPVQSSHDPPSDSGEKGLKTFIPPAEKHFAHQQVQQRRLVNTRNGNQNQCAEGQGRNHGSQNHNERSNQGGQGDNNQQSNQAVASRRHTPSKNKKPSKCESDSLTRDQCPPLRQPVKPTPEPNPIQSEPPPTAKVVKAESMKPEPTKHKPTKPEPTKPEPMKPDVSASRLGSLGDVTPRKPLVPTNYVIEKLPADAMFVAAVMSLATECGSKQTGWLCLTLNDEYSGMYDKLCDDFKLECEKDSEELSPRIGETFAYLCEEDTFWYRARCLSRTRAALLDAGRVVSITPRFCRRLPASYTAIPEFMAVLKSDKLTTGENLHCTVVKATSDIKVSVQDSSGKTVVVDVVRWLPELEYTTELQPSLRQSQLDRPAAQQTVKPAQAEPAPQDVKPGVSPQVVKVERKPLVPTDYMIEKLAVGTAFLAEAIALAGDCATKQTGCVCLTLHESYSEVYDQLCEDFKEQCEKDSGEYTPTIGETFAYLCEEDTFWYRARCLARTRAALLDAGRVVSFTPRFCRRLPASFATIPEFMAVLKTNELTIGDNLSCTIISVSANNLRVTIDHPSGKKIEVDAMRWLPEVEYPAEPPAAPIARPVSKPVAPISKQVVQTVHTVPTAQPTIPTVARPSISHNSTYVVLDVTSLKRACVRPSDPRLAAMFDGVIRDTLIYALTATPLKEPPQKGQTVIAMYIEDGTYYRALVKRVNVAMNKYLIEYIEYGNEEIVPLERLYPCPAKLELEEAPTQASFLKLSDREPSTLTQAATKYIDNLKDNAIELILTITGGVKTAPSGSLAKLLIAKNCEVVNMKIEELCTPEWQKLLERGGDVLEIETRFFNQLKYSALPTSRPFFLRIPFCDVDTLASGAVSGYEKGDKSADLVYGELTDMITEYCNSPLCREPYTPRLEELCITKNKRLNKWVRSVLVQLPKGPGSEQANVLQIDYGELEIVPVSGIRKMMPEFVDQYPATAQHCEIKDFPRIDLTPVQLKRAMQLIRVNEDGSGLLRVTKCREIDVGMFELEVPEFVAALTE